MSAPAVPRDPRSIITPDAFDVSADLLGMPLASPERRLVAMLIDLTVIGFLVLVTKSFALVLGVVAAIFFLRAGFKRTPVRGSVFGRAMRLSVGCFGLVIAVVTAALWSAFGFDFGRDDTPRSPVAVVDGTVRGGDVGLGDLLSFAGGGLALSTAEDSTSAHDALRLLVGASRGVGVDRPTIRETLLDQIPEDKDWSDRAPVMIEAVLDELYGPAPDRNAPVVDSALAAQVAELPIEEAWAEYALLLESDDETVEARRAALGARLLSEVATDTLRALERSLLDVESEKAQRDLQLEAASVELEEATSGGIFGWLRRFVDELGFGFGWASLYLTVILSWLKGQTVGKKIMGLRVVRLDGEPITWWVAFERAGGYAAGFATGLLGFAQVYWDANRQAIHDRIVGTVVVLEGAERVGNWEEVM